MSSEFLEELHWEDGFAIPVANQENKTLEDQLSKLQKEKSNLQDQLRDYEDRINSMTSHLKNVNQEFSFTQSLYKAREYEIESEEHFKAIAERELGRVKDEIQRLNNEMASIQEHKSDKENGIFKATQKLDGLKCQMNWDQQALEAWLEESAHKDSDAFTLQKYSQQDDNKIRALTLQLERLTLECNEKRKVLDRELTETLSAQLELDKASQDFRKVHYERQELIRQWEDTIEQMQRRDQEIDDCALALARVKQEIREKESVVREKIKFLEDEIGNNVEFERKICAAERRVLKCRMEYQRHEASRSQLKDELDSLKATLSRTSSDLEALRKNISKVKKDIHKETAKLQKIKHHNEIVKRNLKTITEKTMSAEEKATNLEDMLKEEEKGVKNDLYFIKKSNSKNSVEKESLTSKMNELNLFVDRSEKELNKARGIKQDLMIEDNILKLEVKRTREMLYGKAEEVLSLERRKQQLCTAMAERTEEIKVHKAMLASEIRYVDQERQSVSAEFHERLSKIDKLKNRYEILTVVMLPPEGEEERTQTYYVIKAAQEKEELQREGDSLDAKINKAEKEIYALENTLQVLNSCNSNYKQSFKKVTPSSDEYGVKIQLEEQKRAADEKYRYKQRQIRELQEDIQSMENTFEVIEHLANNAKEKFSEKQACAFQLQREIEEQKPKFERVTKQCARLTKEIRILKHTKEETLEEQDIKLREVKQFHKDIDGMLVHTMENPEIQVILQSYFEQNGVELPTVPTKGSSQSSRSPSQSSQLSVRSLRSSGANTPTSQTSVKVVELSLPDAPPGGNNSRSPSTDSTSRIPKDKKPSK